MIPIHIQVSRSKVKVKGQAYSSHVGEGGHLCFTNSYIFEFCSGLLLLEAFAPAIN